MMGCHSPLGIDILLYIRKSSAARGGLGSYVFYYEFERLANFDEVLNIICIEVSINNMDTILVQL